MKSKILSASLLALLFGTGAASLFDLFDLNKNEQPSLTQGGNTLIRIPLTKSDTFTSLTCDVNVGNQAITLTAGTNSANVLVGSLNFVNKGYDSSKSSTYQPGDI
jgi:hypothetical protein